MLFFRVAHSKKMKTKRHYMWNLEGLYEYSTTEFDLTVVALFVLDGTLHLMEKNAIHPLMVSCMRVGEAIHIIQTKSVVYVKKPRKAVALEAARLKLILTLDTVIIIVENEKASLISAWILFHE